MMKKIICCFLIVVGHRSFSQSIPDYGYNKIRLSGQDANFQFETLPSKNITVKLDRIYYWYAANTLHQTTGGYSGKLLNGSYKEYYLNKNLKEEGVFKEGLMDGVWKSWDENGTLLSAVTWQKGVRNGTYLLLDSIGQKKESGSYRNGLRQGPIVTYANGVSSSVDKYNDGLIVPRKTPFYKKIRLFKKRKKDQNATKEQ